MFKKFVAVPLSILMLATMFVFVSGVNSFAQPAWLSKSAEEMPQAFMEAEDANDDGKVTMNEFKGPEDEFNFFDKNADGVIELSEAPTPDTLPEEIGETKPLTVSTVTINGVDFEVTQPMYTWAELPDKFVYEREPLQTFTDCLKLSYRLASCRSAGRRLHSSLSSVRGPMTWRLRDLFRRISTNLISADKKMRISGTFFSRLRLHEYIT